MKVNVLGTKYTIKKLTRDEDSKLNECDGYCDHSTKQIVYLDCESVREPNSIADMSLYEQKVLRHEIIHAFMYESGLWNNSIDGWATNEEMTDWIAIQFPKMIDAFMKVDSL